MPDITAIRQQFPDLVNLNPLNQGGQKWVYSGNHATEGEIVLKLIQPSTTPEIVDSEILAVETINSHRVPKIYEYGTVNIGPLPFVWIREQKIRGQSLRQRLAFGTLSVTELLKFSLQMLEALSEAENNSIVHRDVKPDNVMVDAQGDYWLLDFGIARHLTMAALTATSAPFGRFTPGYAPVEQFQNIQKQIDARADLFALGVTIHECWTGHRPFWASNVLEILRNVEIMPLPLLDVPCNEKDSFRDLVAAMTKKRRDQRPTTVAEALEWMREIASAENV